jgi:hypothetical protein
MWPHRRAHQYPTSHAIQGVNPRETVDRWEADAIGQIGHSLIPMGLAVLRNQDLNLYGSPGYPGLDSI